MSKNKSIWYPAINDSQSNDLCPIQTQITICFPFCKVVYNKVDTLKDEKTNKSYFVSILDMFESKKRLY